MQPSTVSLLWMALPLQIGLFSLLWVTSVWRRNVTIVDTFWPLAFVWLSIFYWYGSRTGTPRSTLVLGLVGVWGIRLALYLTLRNWGEPEDRRYRAMREYWGPRFWWVSWLTVFALQALLAWIVAMPLYAVMVSQQRDWTPWDVVGLSLWLTGFAWESVADWQLYRFRARSPAGAVLRNGLWRYSRHPNYFGEALVWWGFYVFAGAAGSWWTIFSPALMTFLLLRVSGVPLLERAMSERRPEYAEYRRTTNAFFPWFPRKP